MITNENKDEVVESKIFYRDVMDNPCQKNEAVGGEVLEYDVDGIVISSTMFEIDPPESSNSKED